MSALGFSAKIILDSIVGRHRLTTVEMCMPRFLLAELNTHRDFTRSSASSRAIPVAKRIAECSTDPFVPEAFGRNQKGMQQSDVLVSDVAYKAERAWRLAGAYAATQAEELARLEVHKQYANRVLEPFLWHTVIVSSTKWGNFRGLRVSPMAQPEFEKIARMTMEVVDASTPTSRAIGEWHLPYVDGVDLERPRSEGFNWESIRRISIARCARVSYLSHDGLRAPKEDIGLFMRLGEPGHMAPFEHVACATGEIGQPMMSLCAQRLGEWVFGGAQEEPENPLDDVPGLDDGDWDAFMALHPRIRQAAFRPSNFVGWTQYRKLIKFEEDFSARDGSAFVPFEP